MGVIVLWINSARPAAVRKLQSHPSNFPLILCNRGKQCVAWMKSTDRDPKILHRSVQCNLKNFAKNHRGPGLFASLIERRTYLTTSIETGEDKYSVPISLIRIPGLIVGNKFIDSPLKSI